jgi:tryptophan synthase alpha chain
MVSAFSSIRLRLKSIRSSSSMHNRIDDRFARLRKQKRKGFIPYICAGDPNLKQTVDLALALEKTGADVIELGLPFSDPLADGIVNQLAAQRALAAGTTISGVFDCVRKIRLKSQIPIVLYSYLNPIFQFGADKFHREAKTAGVDGLLILDLPPEENGGGLGIRPTPRDQSRRSNKQTGDLIHIRLIAPTTPPDRIKKIAQSAKGFIYYVSREGVTGARDSIANSLKEKITDLRKHSKLPIAVGFGISNPKQAHEVAEQADAVVVGSAIVALIAKHGDSPETIEKVGAFAGEIAEAIHSLNR